MEKETESLLSDAFLRNAVYGIFVHFQRKYSCSSYVQEAFNEGKRFLDILRSYGIPCVFLLNTDNTPVNVSDNFRNKTIQIQKIDTLNSEDRPHIILPNPTELIVNYAGQDDCFSATIENKLSSRKRPVFLCGGLYSRRCLSAAVDEIFDKIDGANVIVVNNATDDEPDAGAYLEHLKKKLKDSSNSNRLHVHPIHQITNTLRDSHPLLD